MGDDGRKVGRRDREDTVCSEFEPWWKFMGYH